jgi:adenylate cyclase
MTRLTAAIFQHFTDPAAELRYRREQRTAQVKFIRALMIIGPAMLSAYIIVNPLFVELKYGIGMLVASVVMLPLLGFYYWYVGHPTYAGNRWIDVLFFAVIAGVQFFFIRFLWQSGATGWPFYAILCYNQMLLLTYACLAFAAAVREFIIWAFVSIAYVMGTVITLDLPPAIIVYTATFYVPFAGLVAYVNWAIDDKARQLFESGLKLDVEKKKTEALLHNVLPQSIARRLQSGETIADGFDNVSILFVDVVGFTNMSKTMPASELVKVLNAFFSKADAGCDLFGIEKVKTIGDAFMAVSGAIVPTPRPAKAMVDFACYLLGAAKELSREFGLDFKLRVGINTGPVVGGVISSKRMHYDYWGDSINVAARMESAAPPNGITVSQSTWEATRDSYQFLEPRSAILKGLGEVPVYDVDLRR